MRGDFSTISTEQMIDYEGVLQQQGRVLLDSDWNDQQAIMNYWKELFSCQVLGQDVVAVPKKEEDSFKVMEVSRGTEKSQNYIRVKPGQAWIHGKRLVSSDSEQKKWPISLVPHLTQGGLREALLMKCWTEEISAYQHYMKIGEPALGGPDTTCRIVHRFQFERWPQTDETCEFIRKQLPSLVDEINQEKIKLKVDFSTTTEQPVDGNNCPAIAQGGYRGLEHYLYRIEYDEIEGPCFKWSHLNGGLVGNGYFQKEGGKWQFIPSRNVEAIRRSGLERYENLYLETYKLTDDKEWEVEIGATVELVENNLTVKKLYKGSEAQAADIISPGSPSSGASANESALTGGSTGVQRQRFFRLWTGFRLIKDFSARKELQEGIFLEFNHLNSKSIRPGDYWQFKVRAHVPGERPDNFAPDQFYPPHGPQIQYGCLGIVDWAGGNPESKGIETIHDCRRIFSPLVDQEAGCCIEVSTDEDLATAVDELSRWGGGCICLMPGEHLIRRQLKFKNLKGITFKGSGPGCLLKISEESDFSSVFLIENSTDLQFSGFRIIKTRKNLKNIFNLKKSFQLKISDTQIVCSSDENFNLDEAVTLLSGDVQSGLHLKSNLWVAQNLVDVEVLTDVTITENWFSYHEIGISASIGSAWVVENNRFMLVGEGKNLEKLKTFFGNINPIRVSASFNSFLSSLGRVIGSPEEGINPNLLILTASIKIGWGMRIRIHHNLLLGAKAFSAAILIESEIQNNQIWSSVTGIESYLINRRVEITGNFIRPFQLLGGSSGQNAVAIELGGGCDKVKISHNVIENCQIGIRFDNVNPVSERLKILSVLNSYQLLTKIEKEKINQYEQYISLREKESPLELMVEIFSRISQDMQKLGEEDFNKKIEEIKFLIDARWPVSNVDIIQNDIRAYVHGIELSGDRSLSGWSIQDNTLKDCEAVAIYIPAKNVNFYNSDINKITGNLVVGKGMSLWTLSHLVRVEDNDFFVEAGRANVKNFLISLFQMINNATDALKYLSTSGEVDFDSPEVGAAFIQAFKNIRGNKGVFEKIKKTDPFLTHLIEESFAFDSDLTSEFKIGDQFKIQMFTRLLNVLFALMRGFGVSLFGPFCKVTGNRLVVQESGLFGGLLVVSSKAEIADNEISAPQIGLFVYEDPKLISLQNKMNRTSGFPLQIKGNKVGITQVVDGKFAEGAFSLLANRALIEDISVCDNQLFGPLHIGPLLSVQLLGTQIEGLPTVNLVKMANNMFINFSRSDSSEKLMKFIFSESRNPPPPPPPPSSPTDAYSIALAERKKKAEENYMTSLGVSKTAGFSLSDLVDPNSHLADKTLNVSKYMVIGNQIWGDVEIYPFGFGLDLADLTKAKIFKESVVSFPLVTFNSNQIEGITAKVTVIAGYQTVVVGNQFVGGDPFAELPKVFALGLKDRISVAGNMSDVNKMVGGQV